MKKEGLMGVTHVTDITYGLEMCLGAVPCTVASAAPHGCGQSTNVTRISKRHGDLDWL